MSNLLITDVDFIDLYEIKLISNHKNYMIQFKKDKLILSGIPFICNVQVINSTPNEYFVKLTNNKEILFLKKLDKYFENQLTNYSSLLHYYKGDIGLIFYKNNIISPILYKQPTRLYLNIKFINKGYYNTPIIHIIIE